MLTGVVVIVTGGRGLVVVAGGGNTDGSAAATTGHDGSFIHSAEGWRQGQLGQVSWNPGWHPSRPASQHPWTHPSLDVFYFFNLLVTVLSCHSGAERGVRAAGQSKRTRTSQG